MLLVTGGAVSEYMHEAVLHAIGLLEAGRRDEAVVLLRRIVQHDPTFAPAWKWLAFCTSDPREALDATWRVLKLDPADPWAREAWPVLQQRAKQLLIQPVPRELPRRHPNLVLWGTALLLITLLLTFTMGPDFIRSLAPQSIRDASTSALAPEPHPTETLPPHIADMVIIQETTEYYTFYADDVAAIQRAIYTQGPKLDDGGEKSIAATGYELWVTWDMHQTPLACEISNPLIHLDIEYIYPNWVPTGSPPAWLYSEWDAFIEQVVRHEEYHAQIALECAYDLGMELSELNTQPRCTQLQDEVNHAIDKVSGLCEERQEAFDAAEGWTNFPLPR